MADKADKVDQNIKHSMNLEGEKETKQESDKPNFTGAVAPGPANRDLSAPENTGE
jgi:hypothetical protein